MERVTAQHLKGYLGEQQRPLSGQCHLVDRRLVGQRVRLIGGGDHQLEPVLHRHLVGDRRQRDRDPLGRPGTNPFNSTGATASCGRTAELGPGVVRPFTERSISAPRSHRETKRVADVVLLVTSRSTRPLPITGTGSGTGLLVKVAD